MWCSRCEQCGPVVDVGVGREERVDKFCQCIGRRNREFCRNLLDRHQIIIDNYFARDRYKIASLLWDIGRGTIGKTYRAIGCIFRDDWQRTKRTQTERVIAA